jgi:hypothetical protein
MSSVSTDDPMRNDDRWARIKWSAGLGLLTAAIVGIIAPFAAESGDDLKLPASFRHWYHVNTMVIDTRAPRFRRPGSTARSFNAGIASRGRSCLLRRC